MRRTPLIAGLACLLWSCGTADCIVGTGDPVTRVIPVATLNALVNTGSFQVEVLKGDTQRVEVTAQAEVIDALRTTVDNGVWKIGTNGCVKSDKAMSVRITLPMLILIATEGSGEVRSANVFNSGKTDLRVIGSGSVTVDDINEDHIQAEVEGSGSITIAGTCRELDLLLRGSGSFAGEDLSVNEAEVDATGSGDAQLTVISDLEVDLTGSGSVLYRGAPEVVSDISGSGSVRPLAP